MTDEEIKEELLTQKVWWEKRVEEYKSKLQESERELAKVKRLLELIEQKHGKEL